MTDFLETLSRKCLPKEIESEDSWKHSQSFGADLSSYQNKCQTIHLLLGTIQVVLEKSQRMKDSVTMGVI